jgi:D-glycero-D-manno-heptose 1,7-bisphosphate phosphatase
VTQLQSIDAQRGRPAVFLDRDGTLIEDVHYIAKPEQVVLSPGAGAAVRRLNKAGILTIVVTNQSGIARGRITEEQYEAVRKRTDELLAAADAHIDASYYCPHLPEVTGPCECRKPGVALYRQAASEHGIDFSRSFFIGDRFRDVMPATTLGGRGILVPSRDTPFGDMDKAKENAWLASNLDAAVDRVLQRLGM